MSRLSDALGLFQDLVVPETDPRAGPFKLAHTIAQPKAIVVPSADTPDELRELWSLTDGARLFEDIEYGQWGLILLGSEASERETKRAVADRSDFRGADIVVGTFLGDLDLLVYSGSEDPERQWRIAEPLDDRSDWIVLGPSLADFLMKYFAEVGQKYWGPS